MNFFSQLAEKAQDASPTLESQELTAALPGLTLLRVRTLSLYTFQISSGFYSTIRVLSGM